MPAGCGRIEGLTGPRICDYWEETDLWAGTREHYWDVPGYGAEGGSQTVPKLVAVRDGRCVPSGASQAPCGKS